MRSRRLYRFRACRQLGAVQREQRLALLRVPHRSHDDPDEEAGGPFEPFAGNLGVLARAFAYVRGLPAPPIPDLGGCGFRFRTYSLQSKSLQPLWNQSCGTGSSLASGNLPAAAGRPTDAARAL